MSDTPLDPMSEFGLATAKAVRLAAAEAGCCADDSWRGHLCPYHQGVEDGMDAVLHVISPDLVVAALIESGWRPTDDQLRAMGGSMEDDSIADEEPGGLWWFPRPASGFSPYGRELTEDELAFIEDIAASDLPVWQPRTEETTDAE